MTMLTTNDLQVGAKYNWKRQPERLTYMGRKHYPGDRRTWYQFALVGKPGNVYSEITEAEIHMLEETKS